MKIDYLQISLLFSNIRFGCPFPFESLSLSPPLSLSSLFSLRPYVPLSLSPYFRLSLLAPSSRLNTQRGSRSQNKPTSDRDAQQGSASIDTGSDKALNCFAQILPLFVIFMHLAIQDGHLAFKICFENADFLAQGCPPWQPLHFLPAGPLFAPGQPPYANGVGPATAEAVFQ